jgi:hypothetical protein
MIIMLNNILKTILLFFIFLMSFHCFGQKTLSHSSDLDVIISCDTTISIQENFIWQIDTIKYVSNNKKTYFVMIDNKKFSINEIKFPVWPKNELAIFGLNDKIIITGAKFKLTPTYFPLLIDE